MRRSILLALCLGLFAPVAMAGARQDLPPQDPPASELDEVLVEGQRGLAATTRFVRTVAPPLTDRGMARWNGPVCVGALNMQADAAQAMADRVSDWAHSLGISIGAPGCEPNIIIVAADEVNRAAQGLVAARPRQFRIGAPGADRGAAALRLFQSSGTLVRWWHVSLPINIDTGAPAVRLPGQGVGGFGDMTRPSDFGPNAVASGSRLTRRVRDDLQQAIIVFDDDVLDRVTFAQLSDYVAMVALAHIDPTASVPGFPSILNLFQDGGHEEPTLTEWDRAFLQGLYSAEQTSDNSRANASEVADSMRRALDRLETVAAGD